MILGSDESDDGEVSQRGGGVVVRRSGKKKDRDSTDRRSLACKRGRERMMRHGNLITDRGNSGKGAAGINFAKLEGGRYSSPFQSRPGQTRPGQEASRRVTRVVEEV